MERIRLNARNQIVIPAKIAAELGIAPGDEFIAEVRDGRLYLKPVPIIPVDGSAPNDQLVDTRSTMSAC